jgi:Tfp pilus assembly protein PilN
MITINLKPGTKRQAPKGDPMAVFRERWQALRDKVKEPGLVLAGGTWLVVLLALGFLFLRTNSRLTTLEPQMQTAQDEYKRYHNFVSEKKREGRARDSILAQIGTISAVDQDRFVWAHILDEIAGAIPDFTWLTSVSPLVATGNQLVDTDSTAAPPVTVLIVGQTNDLQNYTAFLRRLGESHWLTNVVPVKTETIIDKNNRPITAFTVQATFTHADSSRVQTVPILESTVR